MPLNDPLMLPFVVSLARAAGAALAELLEAIPPEVWLVAGGMAVGSAGTFYGIHQAGQKPSAGGNPTATFNEDQVRPAPRDPAPWSELEVFKPPADTLVMRDTIRITKEVAKEPEGRPPGVTYEADLLEQPQLTAPIPYAVLPFSDNQRPNISVGADKVSIRVMNPRNAGWLEYRYEVPQPTWALTVSGSVTYSTGDPQSTVRQQLAPALSLNLSRAVGEYTIEGTGSLATGPSWWSVGFTVERSLWTDHD